MRRDLEVPTEIGGQNRIQRNGEIGQSGLGVTPLHRSKDNRGISFCETISSSKSQGSSGSVVEIDDGSSSFAGSHEEDEESQNDDDGDLDAKIRWFFLTIENHDSTEGSAPIAMSDEENLIARSANEERLYFCQNQSESDKNISTNDESSDEHNLLGKRKAHD